jgi:ATP-binding cassette subfamily F protein 3
MTFLTVISGEKNTGDDMMQLDFQGLNKSFHGQKVLDNISGKINRGEKIGFIGANGIGKTTLARILAGEETPDTGIIKYSPPSPEIFYLEQYPVFTPGITPYQELYQTVLKYSKSKENPDTLVKKSLNQAGIREKLWTQEAGSLSGGEKTKLMLAKVLVRDCDFLILDEPTNHLDMESSAWLEEIVQKMHKTVLVISHDRYFLDKIADKIWELTARGLKCYDGNYSSYKTQKEKELKNAQRDYEKQQARIKHLKETINEMKNRYASAHKAAGQNDFYRAKAKKHAGAFKAKETELKRLEKNLVEMPKRPRSPAFEIINKNVLNTKLPPVLIQAENLMKKYGEKVVFQNVSFNLRRGEKVALVGGNGTGKTTLLKIICDIDREYQGSLKVNPSLHMGYFAQELEVLDHQASILDNVLTEQISVQEARILLANLLFPGDDVFKKVAVLSMGEKCRVAFAKLILSGANLLVLDEPTNHLDIISKEKIEEVLEEFGGSVLLVSHDRYLVQRIAHKIMQLEEGQLKYYDGGYDYYLSKSRKEEKQRSAGIDDMDIINHIRRLEYELAYLGGKLSEKLDEEEKARLNEEFLAKAKELNSYRK